MEISLYNGDLVIDMGYQTFGTDSKKRGYLAALEAVLEEGAEPLMPADDLDDLMFLCAVTASITVTKNADAAVQTLDNFWKLFTDGDLLKAIQYFTDNVPVALFGIWRREYNRLTVPLTDVYSRPPTELSEREKNNPK